ncbi:MAG: type IV secretory system conjugative DNA transfer family protein, partial [Actinobacteria bacterium]|nr:type IV secretory system conjugative DNA transfer family protein [Actinomycetota bacterium]
MTDTGHKPARRQVHLGRPVEPERGRSVLRQWAADARNPQLVLEAVAEAGEISYHLATIGPALGSVTAVLTHTLPGTTLTKPTAERPPVQLAMKLKATSRHRPLRTDDPETTVRAILSALAQTGRGERLVLQLLLGPRRVPLAVPTQSPSSIIAPWYQVAWHGKGGTVDSEKRAALREKVSDHGFACAVRIGVTANSVGRRRALVLGLLAAIRTSEAPGILLKLRPEQERRLNSAVRPLLWPLRLNVNELLALTAWPLGSDDLPGLPATHPRPLPPAPGMTGTQRVIARASAPGVEAQLALPVQAALQHLHVIGPTGVGKSVLLGRL